jgi:hypothetical protein
LAWFQFLILNNLALVQVKSVMMNSKLPLPTLGKIWDLADADKDGMLDKHEFTVVSTVI